VAGHVAPVAGIVSEEVLPDRAGVLPRVETGGDSSSTSSDDEGGPAIVKVDVKKLFKLR
jgi:hypothetical protein